MLIRIVFREHYSAGFEETYDNTDLSVCVLSVYKFKTIWDHKDTFKILNKEETIGY